MAHGSHSPRITRHFSPPPAPPQGVYKPPSNPHMLSPRRGPPSAAQINEWNRAFWLRQGVGAHGVNHSHGGSATRDSFNNMPGRREVASGENVVAKLNGYTPPVRTSDGDVLRALGETFANKSWGLTDESRTPPEEKHAAKQRELEEQAERSQDPLTMIMEILQAFGHRIEALEAQRAARSGQPGNLSSAPRR